ncbi:SDR family NAD(P)-dependent oxidoreductase [Paenibacillus sp. FJAT-26967]|uniref:SDR family NAD(P)-dependent oxidoreductase n=1 Tax=Paenibacillus sp. FJAT-26967 TaxID=1729690 RepID=UPI0008381B36|nr:SDR family NAD(P)-dependent oxidoreductase [Paenibacillus sp. FJAT-26967]
MTTNNSPLDLTGQTALVTGAASGIGLAAAQTLAAHGAKVMLLDMNEAGGRESERLLTLQGHLVRYIPCDVTRAEDCQAAVETAVRETGRIDIVFNNAGIIRRKTVVELTEEQWDLVIDVSLKGTFLLSKYAIPVMEKNGGGSIINTGSGWGLKGGDQAAAYCAAKAGVVNLTRGMAIDHGPAGIRVNCVCPGDTDTPLLRDEAKQLRREEASFLIASAERPLNRLGTPQDIANAVLFLASGMSAWITGSVLVVDGGGLA